MPMLKWAHVCPEEASLASAAYHCTNMGMTTCT